MLKIRLLGSGTSSGVPRIGNDWGDCNPTDPRNRRTRASVLVSTETTTILVDTSPDMREQLLAAGTTRIDAVIWTHDHADHTHGIDDLRQLMHLNGGRPIIGYARSATCASLEAKFGYVFQGRGGYPATADLQPLPDALTIGDINVQVADQPHGRIFSAGLRFDRNEKSIGYATDFHQMTSDMRALYTGLDVWVVDVLRRTRHPTHPHLAEAMGWVGELSPRQVALVHMDTSMDYIRLAAELPDGVQPGYDGLELFA